MCAVRERASERAREREREEEERWKLLVVRLGSLGNRMR
jgi:hypothetical protein